MYLQKPNFKKIPPFVEIQASITVVKFTLLSIDNLPIFDHSKID
jgi:hypothetical protein